MSKRIIEISKGIAMIVTDLHGNWKVYCKYRDIFFDLFSKGQASRLIFCGDIIHSDGSETDDKSLEIILDIIELQEKHGNDVITMIMGNHELPHIYGIPLSKGNIEYTPRFESTLCQAGEEVRKKVISFIDNLPFYIATNAGVMISHAGAEELASMDKYIDILYNFSHQDLIAKCESELLKCDLKKIKRNYTNYDLLMEKMYNVTTPDDPRYNYLLRSEILYKTKEFDLLWKTFFGQNERGIYDNSEHSYRIILNKFLKGWSKKTSVPQNFLVAGHMKVINGFDVISEKLLRIASWAHSTPQHMGTYLLLNCKEHIISMNELVASLGRTH